MQIVKTQIELGVEKPFTFLQTTDTHLVFTDENDTEARREFARARGRDFSHAEENAAFIRQYVAKTGYPIVHTGDLMDFITPANLRFCREFVRETGMMVVAGNHEQAHCVNNVFCPEDYAGDMKRRDETLDAVQAYFNNDIRFTCREIGGVNFVGIDNGNYQINQDQFEKLKSVVAEGKPILLFMHIPLYSKELQARHYDCYLAPPEDVLATYTPWQVYEQKADEQTLEACAYIRSQELIKYVICGHLHFDHETQDPTEIKQIVTGLDTLREITVV